MATVYHNHITKARSTADNLLDYHDADPGSIPVGDLFFFFMPPTSMKLRRHIGLGLSRRPCVRECAPAWVTLCIRSRTVRDRILKFDMWNMYER